MKRISNYKTFINESSGAGTLNEEQINFLNRCVRGKWNLGDESVVDIDGDFDCFNEELSYFKGIKFGKINGDFNCSYNNLTSLEGCPKEVGGNFYCHYNNLTSLEGGPEKVGGDFHCAFNNLSSLEGAPKEIGGNFNCSHNNLTSLEGCPKEVGEIFYLVRNEGVSPETLKLIFSKMIESKSDYKTALKSSWKDIPIEDKILLYTPNLDWFDPEEASKLSKLKKYNGIKKMI